MLSLKFRGNKLWSKFSILASCESSEEEDILITYWTLLKKKVSDKSSQPRREIKYGIQKWGEAIVNEWSWEVKAVILGIEFSNLKNCCVIEYL